MLKRATIVMVMGLVPGICRAAMAPPAVEHHGATILATAECLACHGPATAVAKQCDPANSHRSDKPYPVNGGGKFAPASAVTAKGLQLPAGVITCLTCHDLARPAASHLALPMTDSALCLACHSL
ncbi:MAG TPA: hypothetical protein VIU41_09340 [Geobacteraceae bacterium]